MIVKSYNFEKIDLSKNKIFLFYGENEYQKKKIVNYIANNNEILKYDQNEILENNDFFYNNIYNASLFEDKKILIINKCSDKLINIVENLNEDKLSETKIILLSDILEKKSKLRNIFEKKKNLICVAFYPDTDLTLLKEADKFFKKSNISISSDTINQIIRKANGKRTALYNEIEKIKLYTNNGKNINNEKLLKLINLSENHSLSELVDNCLIKNKKKTITILNENNFNNEDCIIIIRMLLSKSKKILQLSSNYKKNKNIDQTILSARPPIFWKDKEIVKKQILQWRPENIRQLIIKINEIELLIKKNLNNSINLVTDFLLEQCAKGTNS